MDFLLLAGPFLIAVAAFIGAARVLTRARPQRHTWLGVALLVVGLCLIGCYGVVFVGLSHERFH
jgi:drug/metabolite transporter (DMT)-like permease